MITRTSCDEFQFVNPCQKKLKQLFFQRVRILLYGWGQSHFFSEDRKESKGAILEGNGEHKKPAAEGDGCREGIMLVSSAFPHHRSMAHRFSFCSVLWGL